LKKGEKSAAFLKRGEDLTSHVVDKLTSRVQKKTPVEESGKTQGCRPSARLKKKKREELKHETGLFLRVQKKAVRSGKRRGDVKTAGWGGQKKVNLHGAKKGAGISQRLSIGKTAGHRQGAATNQDPTIRLGEKKQRLDI